MTRLLFVTWDGPDTTYLEGLFLPLFAGLRDHGIDVSVLQFTWGGAAVAGRRLAAARAAGIGLDVVQVPRIGLLGQAWMLARGPHHVARAARRARTTVLYPRSLLPLAAALRARGPGTRLLFDADGLAADERVDFAGWSPQGARYRVYRDLEAQGIRAADRVVARTGLAREILLARAGAGVPADRVVAIPNGRDEHLFSPGTPGARAMFRAGHGIPAGAPWIVYAGSLGPQYHPAEMLAFHACVRERRPDARLTLLSGARLDLAGFPGADIRSVAPAEVPQWLAAADLGLSLRTPSFSQRGVSPIKVGEYLLCGLPTLATRVGDLDAQLAPVHLGGGGDPPVWLLDDVAPASLRRAAGWLVDDVLPRRDALRAAARAAGLGHFALGGIVDRYAAIIHALPPGSPP